MISLRARLALLAAAPFALTACLSNDGKEHPRLPDAAYVFAITSDYKVGAYAAYGLTSGIRLPDIQANHEDAAVRFRGGSDIFVINRLGRDNLQVVDKNNLKVVMPVKFPDASNPQDVEAKDGFLSVCFLAHDSILVYTQANGNPVGAIDIHAYADNDGFAEAVALRFAGDDLYAVVQNLDIHDPLFKPHANPKLLRINVAKRTVEKAITLPLSNPQGITFNPSTGKLYIPCVGEYTDEKYQPKLDGGIVAFEPGIDSATILVSEEDLGGNVGRMELNDGKLIFDLGMAGADRVEALSLSDKSVTPIVDLAPYAGGGLAVDAGSNTLCVGDHKKGLRLFYLDTFKEKDSTNIDLGLPPIDIAIIR
jgi:DNA-binding beta-propeller fold protein YncE